MRAWLQHHRLSLWGTLVRLAASPVSSSLNVLAIGVVLALPVGAFCLLGNLQALSGHISVEPQISVFLSNKAGKGDIADLTSRISGAPGVAVVRFVSREAAIAELRKDVGVDAVVGALKRNPLPDAFVVTLSGRDPQMVASLEREFSMLPMVSHVQGDSIWANRLAALLKLGQTAVILLSAIICVALVAVTFNTIRLQILTQREEIEVCSLVGATRAYIQRPFLYLGSALGLLGGSLALAIAYLVVAILNSDLAPIATLYGTDLRIRPLRGSDLVAIIATCTGFGWSGAYWSVSRHLRLFDRK